MKRQWLPLLLIPAIGLHAAATGAGQVKHTGDSCSNAYAILGWSKFDVQAAEARAQKDQAKAKKEQAKAAKEQARAERQQAKTKRAQVSAWARESQARQDEARYAQQESDWEEREQHWEAAKKAPWFKVGWMLGRRKFLKQVDSAHEGVPQQVSFHQYRVKDHDGAAAYVAHCGHGGTCNQIASVFYYLHKGIGVPEVLCGGLPDGLIDPTKPEIPIPTDEELAARDAELAELAEDEDDEDDDEDDEDDDGDDGKGNDKKKSKSDDDDEDDDDGKKKKKKKSKSDDDDEDDDDDDDGKKKKKKKKNDDDDE